MGKAVEYKFIPEASVDSTQTCPIEITAGQFAGIVYRYGKIDFKEDGNDGLNVTMEIEMIKFPEGFDQSTGEVLWRTDKVGRCYHFQVEDWVKNADLGKYSADGQKATAEGPLLDRTGRVRGRRWTAPPARPSG